MKSAVNMVRLDFVKAIGNPIKEGKTE